jgi:hypothetical protein
MLTKPTLPLLLWLFRKSSRIKKHYLFYSTNFVLQHCVIQRSRRLVTLRCLIYAVDNLNKTDN